MRFFVLRERGFTLAEVLVVLSILALLMAVVLSNLAEGRKKAHDTQRVSDLAQLQLALRLYKDANGSYPTGAPYDGGEVVGEGGTFDTLIASFVTNTVKDPLSDPSDAAYEYVYDSDFECGGASRIVLYAKSMERTSASNWATVCGGLLPGTNTYGIILR